MPSALPVQHLSFLKNQYCFLMFNLLFSIIVVPNIVYSVHTVSLHESNLFDDEKVFEVLLCLSVITFVTQWSLFLYCVFNKLTSKIYSEGINIFPKQTPICNYGIRTLLPLMMISSNLFFCLLLILRSSAPTCGRNVDNFVMNWNCNPYHDVPIFPLDTALIVVIIPLYFTLATKEEHALLAGFLWFLSFSSLIIGAAIVNPDWRSSGVIIALLCLICAGMLIDSYQQRKHNQELHEYIAQHVKKDQDQDQNSQRQQLSQMKDIIGNVAHDLKTVSLF